jgi:hypothetical protein
MKGVWRRVWRKASGAWSADELQYTIHERTTNPDPQAAAIQPPKEGDA